ncbi:hypothetical protein C8A03DRAFT_18477 [Achaetomium macrosporum]|uniref:Caib baif family enzyme n=1 Tax=Achaetomium macrosporum TaxID=79813 RepID=A0AAN7H8R4_9PEZI|nr:hypothetical protein C8A03DRAFT_18477 [Achaetomium macrosporum]
MVSGEIKILTPTGMLGYSFSEDLFWSAVKDGVDAIILDSGSTDSGPAKLALGQTTTSRQAYERDLRILVSACHHHRVPVLIGSAGGDGTNAHVALLLEIVAEIVAREGFRTLNVVTIEAEIPKSTVQAKFEGGLVTPCGHGVPELRQADINDATVIVAQMGMEPWLNAMQVHPDFDIIIAGRSYDPAPFAAFCVHKGLPDLGLAYHMGKIMECGGVCAVPKSAEALATVRHGSFDIRPLSPTARCTPLSVAAHTLYEKSRPDLLAGPGGVLDVSHSRFEQLEDGRTVRVTGSKFSPAADGTYTVKLEGARVAGYTAMFIGGIRDPIMISQLDCLIPMIQDKLRAVVSCQFELAIQLYGHNPLVKGLDLGCHGYAPAEIGVLGKVLAPTQDDAKTVANLAKVFFTHAPYPGQVANAGNFMMPFSPCDLALGPATEFCVYHLMQVDNPGEQFPFAARATLRDLSAEIKANITPMAAKQSIAHLSPPPPPGFVYLASLASVIRTKNCGPFQLTIDVMFSDRETFERVRSAGILSRETISHLYSVQNPEDIIACLWWETALAFKATIKRPVVSGSFRDNDVHGSGWHVPLLYLQVPAPGSV